MCYTFVEVMKMDANETLRLTCEDVELITGIKTVIYDENRKKIYASPNGMCDFCREIRRSARLLAECRRCDEYGFLQSTQKQDIHIYPCHMGLIEAVTPVTENGRPIGYLMLGQLLPAGGRQRVCERIDALHGEVDTEALHRHLDAMTETDEQHLRATARILSMSAAYVRLHEWLKERRRTVAYELERYVYEHLGEESLSAQSVSSAIGLSRTALYKVCKERFGMGVGEYLRQMRASAAIRLLRTTALPLPLVAERVGLPSAAQLTRLLKSHTGKTAKEIRQGSGE